MNRTAFLAPENSFNSPCIHHHNHIELPGNTVAQVLLFRVNPAALFPGVCDCGVSAMGI